MNLVFTTAEKNLIAKLQANFSMSMGDPAIAARRRFQNAVMRWPVKVLTAVQAGIDACALHGKSSPQWALDARELLQAKRDDARGYTDSDIGDDVGASVNVAVEEADRMREEVQREALEENPDNLIQALLDAPDGGRTMPDGVDAHALLFHDNVDRATLDRRLWAVSLHEAAHAVAIAALGGRVTKTHANSDGSGTCWHSPLNDARKESLVLFAGELGSSLLADSETGYAQERALAAEQVGIHHGQRIASDGHEVAGAWAEARGIVNDHSLAVVAFARLLYDNAAHDVAGCYLHAAMRWFSDDFSADRQSIMRDLGMGFKPGWLGR